MSNKQIAYVGRHAALVSLALLVACQGGDKAKDALAPEAPDAAPHLQTRLRANPTSQTRPRDRRPLGNRGALRTHPTR
ncbi:MAG: hypothetical protein JRJ80_18150 [Deltaproteobacteria bacterium]|nr:hypothetical protein [Deltaproteobacteria bacterium]